MLKVLDLFSGIGGFSLGLERTGGFSTVAFCEIEEFPRRVLKKHWPEVPCYDDVRTLTADTLARDGIGVDVITGGFPCQDISGAGRRAGIDEGTRSGLYAEVIRLARDIRPKFIILENVANLLSGPDERRGWWFGRVLGDLARLGYDAEWENIPAAALGAPHGRERIWIVAHPKRLQGVERSDAEMQRGWQEEAEQAGMGGVDRARSDPHGINVQGLEPGVSDEAQWQGPLTGSVRSLASIDRGIWRAEPEVGRVAYGLPRGLAGPRLKALGNAVVPQIPEMIGRAILSAQEAA